MADENDFRPGDSEVPILRKILNRLGQLVGFGPPGDVSIGSVTLDASDIEIGAVELKDGTTDTRVKITTANPAAGDAGLVVRNIPSGTQTVTVDNFPVGGSGDGSILDGVSSSVKATVFDRVNSNPLATQLVDSNGDPVTTQSISAATLPLPAGAATEVTLATRLSEVEFEARINTLGQKAMVASTPVVLSSDQSTIPISAATLPLPSGAATEATLATRLSESAFQDRINTLGQKTMVASTPVVLASDQDSLNVTVDNFPAGSGDGSILDGASPSIKATVFDRTNSNPLAAQLVDSNGDPVSVGGGTQYSEDSAAAVGEQITMAGVVRRDSQASLVDADGDRTELQVNATGALRVEPVGAVTEATFQARINTLGQKTMANSTPVVLPSDQTAIPVTQSGTWTVQQGNTPSTMPWRTGDDWRMTITPKRYAIAVILTPSATLAGTNLMGLRKLNANADVYIIRIRYHVFHAAAGVASVLGWRRATTVAGGSLVAVADIPKIDTSSGNATLEVRTGAVTGTEGTNQYLLTHPAHSTAAPAAGVGSTWVDEWSANDMAGRIRLTGDEGLILEQVTAGDVDNRYHIMVEWEEA